DRRSRDQPRRHRPSPPAHARSGSGRQRRRAGDGSAEQRRCVVTAAADDTLTAVGVGVEFAGLKALSDIDLELGRGEILGLIGPNGAGKTTLVNVLSGFQKPSSGRVLLGSRDVTGARPYKLAARGLGRTFQSVRVFGRMSVFENVMAG